MDRFVRLNEVREITGRCTASIYADIRLGLFPAQVRIGRRAVAWKLSDIQAWMDKQERDSRDGTGNVSPRSRANLHDGAA